MKRSQWLMLVFFGVLVPASLLGLSVGKNDLLYYEPADRIPGAEPDGKVQKGVRLVPGKFGSSYLIERRTKNDLGMPGTPDCDLIWRDGVQLSRRQKEPVLTISNAGTALPVVDLRAGGIHTFSFDASAPGGKAELSAHWEEPEGKITPVGDCSLTGSVRRIAVSFHSGYDSGTLRIFVKGKAELSRLMLDRKCGWAASFVPYGRTRGTAWVEIKNVPKHFHAAEGSFTAWVKSAALTPDSSGPGCIFFAARSKKGRGKYADVILYPWFGPGSKSQTGSLYFTAVDARDRRVALQERQCDLKFASGDWHFWVFTWKQTGNRMQIAFYVDGDKTKLITDGEAIGSKSPIQLFVGYYNGGYLNGAIDDFAFFGKALTPQDVLELYRSNRSLGETLK